jgi:hypothetical protein
MNITGIEGTPIVVSTTRQHKQMSVIEFRCKGVGGRGCGNVALIYDVLIGDTSVVAEQCSAVRMCESAAQVVIDFCRTTV